MEDLERSQLVKDLRQLTKKFSQGWHEGIEIDATDIMLLAEASVALEQLGVPVAELRDDGKGVGYVHFLSDKVFAPGTKLYSITEESK